MRTFYDRFYKGFFLLTIMLLASVAFAKFSYKAGGVWEVINPDGGNLVLGVTGEDDVVISTNQGGNDPEAIMLDDSAAALVPMVDNNISLGTSSLEFKDAYFDGTVTLDALSMPMSVVAGANTACSTTCTGLCMFGVNTAATEADIVNCADATADECLCVE